MIYAHNFEPPGLSRERCSGEQQRVPHHQLKIVKSTDPRTLNRSQLTGILHAFADQEVCSCDAFPVSVETFMTAPNIYPSEGLHRWVRKRLDFVTLFSRPATNQHTKADEPRGT